LPENRSRFVRRKPENPLTRRDEALAFVASDDSWRPPGWFENIRVVLVEPTDPVNIGGVVRVMANTGFLGLRLVRPTGFDAWHVGGIAHYTQHIVEATKTYESLPEAVADRQFVLAFTGKHHRVERNALPFTDAIAAVTSAARDGQAIALVFGREDWGLSNEMLDACHAVTTIPTNPAYPSLNLAQAALLVLYQLFQHSGGEQQTYRPPRKLAPTATSELLEDLFVDIERSVDAIQFFHSRSRTSVMRSLRVALYRARLDQREAALLRAVFIEIRKFLKRRGVIADAGAVGVARTSATLKEDDAGA
jgi:TrmH family RNA methyltransferase